MQVLSKLLDKLFRRKHRVLIFSSFVGMLDLLEDFCRYRKFKYLRLDGSSNRVQRKFDIARFNGSKEFFIYLISTRAGGLGINLATADTVIHYDSDWNPQVREREKRGGVGRGGCVIGCSGSLVFSLLRPLCLVSAG